MVGAAENVTAWPLQDGFAPAVIATSTFGTTVVEFTIIVMEFEVAATGAAHVALDVIKQVTTCPFAKLLTV